MKKIIIKKCSDRFLPLWSIRPKKQTVIDERRRTQLCSARALLQQFVLLLLSACKMCLRHPDCEYAARARLLLAEQVVRVLHAVERALQVQYNRHCWSVGQPLLATGHCAASLFLHSPHSPPRWSFSNAAHHHHHPQPQLYHYSNRIAARPIVTTLPSSSSSSLQQALHNHSYPYSSTASTTTTGPRPLYAFNLGSDATIQTPHLPSSGPDSTCSSSITLPPPSAAVTSTLINENDVATAAQLDALPCQPSLSSLDTQQAQLSPALDTYHDLFNTNPLLDCGLFSTDLDSCLNLNNQLCQFQVRILITFFFILPGFI